MERYWSDHRGMTLVEVLIASAIGLVVLMVFLTQMYNQLMQLAFLEDKMSQISLESEMKAYLLTPVCLLSVRGMSTSQTPQEVVIRDQNGDPFLQRNMAYNRLDIQSVSVRATAPIGPSTMGMINFQVEMRRQRTGGGSPVLKPISFNVSVRTNATGQIEQCPASNVSEIQTYECFAGRSSICNATTPTDRIYDFCALTRYDGNGDNGGNPDIDHCRVESVGDGVWNLRNSRGNDNGRTCGMICIRI